MTPLSILLISPSLLLRRRNTDSCIYPISETDLQLGIQFAHGPSGDVQELEQLACVFSRRALRYVARNRYSSPMQLAYKSELFVRGKTI